MDFDCTLSISNYLRAIPVPDKTATTAAKAIFNDVFLLLGFPSVLQSDRGGEFLNALLHRLTKLLSVKQVFTSGFRPRLNGATERTHRFLNAALDIYCEHYQEQWEVFLQPVVYAHNVTPISGTSNISPLFLVYGKDAPSPETISLQLPPIPLPPDHYAKHILSGLTDGHKRFTQIKADLRRQQREIYGTKSRHISIPDGKIVYMHKPPSTHKPGLVTRFIRNFDGPYSVTGHPFNRPDMLTLKHVSSGEEIPHPVNIEKVVVVPEPELHDLQASNDSVAEIEHNTPTRASVSISPDNGLIQVAFQIGKYLQSLPSKSATASQPCKFVYLFIIKFSFWEILARHGNLCGLIKVCPYLQLDGAASGGTYV